MVDVKVSNKERLKQVRDSLDELHVVLIQDLVSLIKSGAAKAADRAVAWTILKDNQVQTANLGDMTDVTEQEPIATSYPFNPEEEEAA